MVGCMFIDLSGEYMYSEKLSVIRGFEENTYSVDISTNVNESLDELISIATNQNGPWQYFDDKNLFDVEKRINKYNTKQRPFQLKIICNFV